MQFLTQAIIEGSKIRNSNGTEIWRQKLNLKPWKGMAAACFRAQWTVRVQSVLSSVCRCFLCVKEYAVNEREDWGEKIFGAIGNHGVTHLLT